MWTKVLRPFVIRLGSEALAQMLIFIAEQLQRRDDNPVDLDDVHKAADIAFKVTKRI
ncbi:hypothetical protein [Ferrimonas balearica]|uniref:hypothetical protein n=1 Tax=Ferrimonas balearica TaxID=44012 RepID=UPI001C99B14E|nr:hypothetical protein [Ferrimonas balearica]MBY5992500.1 hypothetical protein [Ferrimonas balearica]